MATVVRLTRMERGMTQEAQDPCRMAGRPVRFRGESERHTRMSQARSCRSARGPRCAHELGKLRTPSVWKGLRHRWMRPRTVRLGGGVSQRGSSPLRKRQTRGPEPVGAPLLLRLQGALRPLLATPVQSSTFVCLPGRQRVQASRSSRAKQSDQDAIECWTA